jgi:DNA primase
MAFGRIPQSFIDDVLLRTDIVDLIDGRVKLKKAGKNYAACCPFHNEKSPSFTVSREKQFYYCFGCGASGNAISFLMDYERLDFIDGLKQLAGQAGLELPDTRDQDAAPRESQQPLYDTLEAAARFYEEQLRRSPAKDKAVGYFKGRGLSGQIAKTYRLGYAPPGWDNLFKGMGGDLQQQERLLATGLLVRNENRQSLYDAMRDRVIFPIRDFRGRVIAFGGRVLTDEKPKYLNSPESPVFHKGQELYGLFEARQATRKLERIVVVEGYMDVVALAQFGITYAVATLGTATSSTHVERIFRLVDEVIFCFDGDDAGRRAAWRALENTLPALQDGKLINFLFLPNGEDPDSLVRKEGPALFEARLKSQTESLAEFFFRSLTEGLRMDTLEGRTRLATEAKPLLARVPDGLYRELLVDELTRMTGLEKATLKAALKDEKLPEPEPPPAPPPGSAPVQRQAQPIRRAARRASAPQSLSLADRAVRLLLQNPSSAQGIEPATLAPLLGAEEGFLLELLTLIHENPGLTTAGLMCSWLGTPQGERLGELAASEFLTPHEGVGQELGDLVKRLELQALSRELAAIIADLSTNPDPALLTRLQALKAREYQLKTTLSTGRTG